MAPKKKLDATDPEGRAKHLGFLAKKFFDRDGTWAELGLFLELLFDGKLPGKSGQLGAAAIPQKCRHHRTSGAHGLYLGPGEGNPFPNGVFGQNTSATHFSMPCLSIGSGEKGKNPGLVLADLCSKAEIFLEKRRRGNKRSIENYFSGEALAGNSTESSKAPLRAAEGSRAPKVARVEKTEAELDVAELAGFLELYEEVQLSDPIDATAAGLYDNLDEDSEEPLDVEEDPPVDYTNEIVSDISAMEGSDPPMMTNSKGKQQRSSTMLRTSVLGYLHQFARDPNRLRSAFRDLRTRETSVLHLCGCGLRGDDYAGCCEGSHLVLGSKETNDRHTEYHAVIKNSRPEDYVDLVRIFQRSRSGQGVF